MQDDSSSIGCLPTALIWCLPPVVVAVIFAVFGSAWPISLTISIGFLIWMGKIDAEMRWRKSGGAVGDIEKSRTGHVVLYVVVQLIGIPLLLIALFWGFCAMKEGGHF